MLGISPYLICRCRCRGMCAQKRSTAGSALLREQHLRAGGHRCHLFRVNTLVCKGHTPGSVRTLRLNDDVMLSTCQVPV